jgi:hypothetical protein
MAATVTLVSQRMIANAAAIATAAAGGLTTADIQSLGAILATLALSQDISIPLIGQSTTPATASTMLVPA